MWLVYDIELKSRYSYPFIFSFYMLFFKTSAFWNKLDKTPEIVLYIFTKLKKGTEKGIEKCKSER